jgi:hypothetical protein
MIGQTATTDPALLRLEGSALLNGGTLLLRENSAIVGDQDSVVRVLTGGYLAGNGALDTAVENSGTIRPTGILSVSGPLKLDATGRVIINLGATNATLPHDQLKAPGEALLGGTLVLELAPGFLPRSSEVYEVVQYSSATDRFARIDGQALPGMVWISTYTSSGLSIALQRLAEVGAVRLEHGQVAFPFPTEQGTVYLVQASSDLGTWETIQTLDGDGAVRTFFEPVTHSRRFYRVLIR